MTPSARRHLEKAQEYLGRGERYYLRAAKQILAAKEAGATNKEAGLFLGRSGSWVSTLLAWHEDPLRTSSSTPYSGQADKINLRKTKQRLREASPEELAAIVASLPDDALDRLINAVIPSEPRRNRRRNVWVGPRRRLRLFQIVRDVLGDLGFARSEIEDMELTAVDEAALLALLAEIEDEAALVRAALGKEKRVAALRAVR